MGYIFKYKDKESIFGGDQSGFFSFEGGWQIISKYPSQLWKDGKNDKLRTYCFIKTDNKIEKYLLNKVPRVQRSKVTSLRIGSHFLEIEKGMT